MASERNRPATKGIIFFDLLINDIIINEFYFLPIVEKYNKKKFP